MATALQTLKANGFKVLPQKFQTSFKYCYHGIVEDGKVVARAGVETGTWDRNPRSVMVEIAGKKREITAEYGRDHWKRFSETQVEKLQALLDEAKAAGPVPEKPKKARPESPMKGVKMSEEQKAENAVWRHLGYLTCVGFVDKEMQTRMHYVKGSKFIRLEDWDSCMAYANIRNSDLEAIGMTVSSLEQFLVSKGIKRKAQKRMKRQFSLYD